MSPLCALREEQTPLSAFVHAYMPVYRFSPIAGFILTLASIPIAIDHQHCHHSYHWSSRPAAIAANMSPMATHTYFHT